MIRLVQEISKIIVHDESCITICRFGAGYSLCCVVYLSYTDGCVGNFTFGPVNAKDSGAALHSHTRCNTTIVHSMFIGNKANRNGVIMENHESLIDLRNNTFCSNDIGDDGGAVFLGNSSKAIIKHCRFTNNVAKDTGGAV